MHDFDTNKKIVHKSFALIQTNKCTFVVLSHKSCDIIEVWFIDTPFSSQTPYHYYTNQ